MDATNQSAIVMQFLLAVTLFIPLNLSAAADAKVVEAARKEGELVWYNTLVQPHANGVIDLFMKQYPFIKATFWRGGGTQVYSKLMIENAPDATTGIRFR